jgi:predicted alpha/beta-fold hydrolase
MDTAFDWVTIVIFAGLVTHFLQQSATKGARPTPLWQYGVAAAGCALANWLGNEGQGPAAGAVIVLTLGFMIYVYVRRPGTREDH